ncbi:hypothetical protein [Microbispora rosea]|uniref:hypothetical protein n=1 Tax=Microbispora rosea TaxID=58117 RepID=UPI003413EB85
MSATSNVQELIEAAMSCPDADPALEAKCQQAMEEGLGLAFYLPQLSYHKHFRTCRNHVEVRTFGDTTADCEALTPDTYTLTRPHGTLAHLSLLFSGGVVSRPGDEHREEPFQIGLAGAEGEEPYFGQPMVESSLPARRTD